MHPAPLISIVMPCYNARAHLAMSVGSVLAQTHPDWELIAVDDGSTDLTLDWLKDQVDPRIRWIHQPNRGVSAARNAGIAVARGESIAFLDADDTWAPDFLERMTQALLNRPDAVLAYCGWQNLGLPGGRGLPFVPPDHETADKHIDLFAACCWPIHAALTRRQAVVGVGGFDASLKNAEDYALWLRVAAEAPIVRVTEVLAYYHFHGVAQASAQRARAALHFMRAQEAYVHAHPAFARSVGRHRLRALTLGNLLQRGYECYWGADLPQARTIFRAVMRRGYGLAADWKYMLPSLLPLRWHARLVDRLRSRRDPNGLTEP